MLLGNRGGAWRCLLVWVVATALAALAAAWSAATARPTWSAAHAGALNTLPLDRALTGLAATALLGCAGWAWAATTATVLEARRGVRSAERAGPWRLPSGVRRVVLAGCGVALVGGLASPALAEGSGHGHGIAGLPLPDRATAPRHHRPDAEPGRPTGTGGHTVVVSIGDSLWSIAAADLPSGAGDALITARWHAVYAANRPLIGPDPAVLEPGQRLRLPGKEAS